MLRYETETRPGLVAMYCIWPGNGAGPFLQPRSPHGAKDWFNTVYTTSTAHQYNVISIISKTGLTQASVTSHKVARHEDEFQLVGVLVLARPQRVVLPVKVLPEVRQRHRLGVIVGVHPFPVLHVECTAHKHTHTNRVPTLLLTKNPGLSRTPMKNFPGPFRSPRMFKYKEKTAFAYNIQSVVHCRKFSMKQNVDVSCSEFR